MYMRYILHKLIILFISAGLPLGASAAYKWVDDEGNVHYSQTKPLEVSETETIKPPLEPIVEKSSTNLEEDERNILILENEKEKKRINEENRRRLAENRIENCERTKKILEELQSYERVKTKGTDGTVRWASDEEKIAQVNQAKSNVKKWCE